MLSVDLFYMKTCSFRGAQPLSTTQGLFCGNEEPQARYSMVPCGSSDCLCCHPINHINGNPPLPIIDINSSSKHQFVNGYTTYLNCPAVCYQLCSIL